MSILPLLPWHVVTLFEEYEILIGFGSVILTESEITHPLSLVIITEYKPGLRLSILFKVLLFDHKYDAKIVVPFITIE